MNQHILRRLLEPIRRDLRMTDFQLWAFIPTAANYVGTLGESLVVYYCVDEWSQLPWVDGRKMLDLERRLCQRADAIFTASRVLYERKRAWNPETHLATHGVDHAHFATALTNSLPTADAPAPTRGPILGFFGLIDEWVDIGLLAYLAERRPDWTIVIIGKALVDLSLLARFPNIRLLGPKPYEALPQYCKHFSVGLIPYELNERSPTINPIKLREYLSAGLPVVSTALPEVARYAEHCAIASSREAFLRAVDAAIQTDSPERRYARSRAMQDETWERKVAVVGQQVERVRAKKLVGWPSSA